MEHPYGDARNPLVPSRSSSLNIRNNIIQEYHKRKRPSLDESSTSSSTFEAVTVGHVQNRQIFNLTPITTLLRAHLPLSWLSNSKLDGPSPGSLLRAEITTVSRWEYQVLVASCSSGNDLFALEKVEHDTYVCHPLQRWVKVQLVEQAAFGAAPPVGLAVLIECQNGSNHVRKHSSASASGVFEPSLAPPSPKVPQNRRGQLARLSILETREKTEEPASLLDREQCLNIESLETPVTEQPNMLFAAGEDTNTVNLQPSTAAMIAVAIVSGGSNDSCLAQTEDVIQQLDHLSADHLRRQYLETLYLSKTSLAFYAKGPLSRARARARAPNTTRSSASLAEFYQSSIISTKKLDLKYKTSLYDKISSLPTREDANTNTALSASRKTRRTKLGKDGLWPLEDEYIERWWRAQDIRMGPLQSNSQQTMVTKSLISQLRVRETEMQILLILEILALEVRDIPNQQLSGVSAISSVKIESLETDDANQLSQVPPAKKKRDLQSDLDFLVDRLCIWNSIGSEETGHAPNDPQQSGTTSAKSKDRLRDFCRDVIMPFYSSKLPQQCQNICLKMGGPEVSPRRSKSGGEKAADGHIPGEHIIHHRPNKRNLERVLSEDQNLRHNSPPLLSRSATLPMTVNNKREPSERPMSRSGLVKSVSFSNREVDLIADAKATAVKRRKLDLVAAQKRELDAAIETLKRPNRSMVAKSFMDDAERRAKENKPTVSKAEPVQIIATPRRGRIKNVQTEEYDLPAMPLVMPAHEEATIPSSTVKPRGLSQISSISRSSAKKRAVLSAMHDTPSRGTVKRTKSQLIVDEDDGSQNKTTETTSSSTLVASTPTISRLRLDLEDKINVTPLRMSRSLRPVLLTPMEKSEVSIEEAFKNAIEVPERAGKIMDRVMGSKTDSVEMTLYETLGWNDDFEL